MLTSWLMNRTILQSFVFFLTINAGIVVVSVGMWFSLRRWHPSLLQVTPEPSVTRSDLVRVSGSVLLNALVSVAGWWLWSRGYLTLAAPSVPRILFDGPMILLTLDLVMYLTHRISHQPPLYQWLHAAHHQHVECNRLSLFVLHPGEVIGFAAMLCGTILLLRPCEPGLVLALTVNLIVGTMGHSGLTCRQTPLPRTLTERLWVFLTTTHLRHHHDGSCNFGFYTVFWDAVFGTLQSGTQSAEFLADADGRDAMM